MRMKYALVAATIDAATIAQKIGRMPYAFETNAPSAGPSTKPSAEPPSMNAFARSSSSRPAKRYGANDAPAVKVGTPNREKTAEPATNSGKDGTTIIARTGGMLPISAQII